VTGDDTIDRCEVPDCGRCLEHLTPEEFDATIARLRAASHWTPATRRSAANAYKRFSLHTIDGEHTHAGDLVPCDHPFKDAADRMPSDKRWGEQECALASGTPP